MHLCFIILTDVST